MLINATAQFDARLYDVISAGKIADVRSSGRPVRANFRITDSNFTPEGRLAGNPDFEFGEKVTATIQLAGNRVDRPIVTVSNGAQVELLGQTEPAATE